MHKTERLNITDNILENTFVKVSERGIKELNTHWHEYYEMEIILEGTGYSEINGIKYKIKKGSLLLITPSDVHRYTDIQENLSIINLAFVPKTLEYSSFADSILFRNSIVTSLDNDTKNDFIFLINKIKKESNSKNHMNKKYISYLLNCLMIEISRLKNENSLSSNNTDQSITKALAYIREHFKEQITLRDVAEEINMSAVYTSKKLSQTLGYGFKELVTKLRIDYAERLLLYTDESITDISYYCGFNSISYFSRAFKKIHNISPEKFKLKKFDKNSELY